MVEDKVIKTNWSSTLESLVCPREKLEIDLFGRWKALKVFDMIVALFED